MWVPNIQEEEKPSCCTFLGARVLGILNYELKVKTHLIFIQNQRHFPIIFGLILLQFKFFGSGRTHRGSLKPQLFIMTTWWRKKSYWLDILSPGRMFMLRKIVDLLSAAVPGSSGEICLETTGWPWTVTAELQLQTCSECVLTGYHTKLWRWHPVLRGYHTFLT